MALMRRPPRRRRRARPPRRPAAIPWHLAHWCTLLRHCESTSTIAMRILFIAVALAVFVATSAQHTGWSTLSIMDRTQCLEYSVAQGSVRMAQCSSTNSEQNWQLQSNSSLLRHSSSGDQVNVTDIYLRPVCTPYARLCLLEPDLFTLLLPFFCSASPLVLSGLRCLLGR